MWCREADAWWALDLKYVLSGNCYLNIFVCLSIHFPKCLSCASETDGQTVSKVKAAAGKASEESQSISSCILNYDRILKQKNLLLSVKKLQLQTETERWERLTNRREELQRARKDERSDDSGRRERAQKHFRYQSSSFHTFSQNKSKKDTSKMKRQQDKLKYRDNKQYINPTNPKKIPRWNNENIQMVSLITLCNNQ